MRARSATRSLSFSTLTVADCEPRKTSAADCSATFFVFLAASARAGVITADLRTRGLRRVELDRFGLRQIKAHPARADFTHHFVCLAQPFQSSGAGRLVVGQLPRA